MTDDEQALRRRAEALLSDESDTVRQARALLTLEEIDAEERAERDLPRMEAEHRADRPAGEHREKWAEHKSAEREFELIASRLEAKVPERRHAAARPLGAFEPGGVPADQFTEVRKDTAAMLAEDGAARRARKLAARERRAASRLEVREPAPYSEGSPHSWIRDTLALRGQKIQSTAGSAMDERSVRARLSHHGQDIRVAVRKGSKFGERAAEIIHEHLRCEDEQEHRRRVGQWRREELRAFGTDGGATASSPGEAAAFVPPAIVLKSWAAWRTPYASFAGQCNAQDIPEWGLNLYVPHVTGEMEVTSQTEGSAVAEKAPTAGLIKSKVVNKAGGIEVSQQFLDRVGPGIAGDQVLFAQLKSQIDTEVDAYALNQALAEAQSVINSTATFTFGESSGGVGGFLNDIRKGKNLVATTAGTRLKATHMFAPSKLVSYAEAWGTSIGGPVWSPALDDNRLPIRSEGDAKGEGYSGYVLSQLAVFSDDEIPNLGTTSDYQVVIADPATILVFRSPPVFAVSPETFSTTLDAELTARVYCACVPRWPEGTATLSGAFYKSSQFA